MGVSSKGDATSNSLSGDFNPSTTMSLIKQVLWGDNTVTSRVDQNWFQVNFAMLVMASCLLYFSSLHQSMDTWWFKPVSFRTQTNQILENALEITNILGFAVALLLTSSSQSQTDQ